MKMHFLLNMGDILKGSMDLFCISLQSGPHQRVLNRISTSISRVFFSPQWKPSDVRAFIGASYPCHST